MLTKSKAEDASPFFCHCIHTGRMLFTVVHDQLHAYKLLLRINCLCTYFFEKVYLIHYNKNSYNRAQNTSQTYSVRLNSDGLYPLQVIQVTDGDSKMRANAYDCMAPTTRHEHGSSFKF